MGSLEGPESRPVFAFRRGAAIPLEGMATYLSKRFTLEQLTRTETGKMNFPKDQKVLDSLKQLAQTLDLLWENIGPFDVLSAYRSEDVQQALIKAGNIQAIQKSYHAQGIAADIAPTTMKVEDYIIKLAANSMVRYKLGQIALKGNALHISLPTDKFSGQLMLVEKDGQYYRKTDSQITDIVKQRLTQAVAAVKESPFKFGAGALALVGVVLFFILRRKK